MEKRSANSLNKAVVELICARGGLAWRNNSGSVRQSYTRKDGSRATYSIHLSPKGSADVLGLYRGRFISVETKTPHDRLTDDQRAWAARVRDCGGYAIEARDLDAVIALLTGIDVDISYETEL